MTFEEAYSLVHNDISKFSLNRFGRMSLTHPEEIKELNKRLGPSLAEQLGVEVYTGTHHTYCGYKSCNGECWEYNK